MLQTPTPPKTPYTYVYVQILDEKKIFHPDRAIEDGNNAIDLLFRAKMNDMTIPWHVQVAKTLDEYNKEFLVGYPTGTARDTSNEPINSVRKSILDAANKFYDLITSQKDQNSVNNYYKKSGIMYTVNLYNKEVTQEFIVDETMKYGKDLINDLTVKANIEVIKKYTRKDIELIYYRCWSWDSYSYEYSSGFNNKYNKFKVAFNTLQETYSIPNDAINDFKKYCKASAGEICNIDPLLHQHIMQIIQYTVTNLPISNIKTITKDDMTNIQASILNSAIISGFSIEHIKILTPEQISFFTPEQISYLTPQQVSNFTSDQIAILSKEQFTNIFNKLNAQVYAILTKEQIQSIIPDESRLQYISNLPSTQLNYFTSSQIQKFPPYMVNALTIQQLESLEPAFINALTSEQMNSLSTQKLAALLSRKELQFASSDQLDSLNMSQLGGMKLKTYNNLLKNYSLLTPYPTTPTPYPTTPYTTFN